MLEAGRAERLQWLQYAGDRERKLRPRGGSAFSARGSVRALAQSWVAGNEGGGPKAGSCGPDTGSGDRLTSCGSCGPWREARLPAPVAEVAVRGR